MQTALCPECEERITLNSHAKLGQTLICPGCEADLEVISLEPLELDWAYDWSDDGWDDSDKSPGTRLERQPLGRGLG